MQIFEVTMGRQGGGSGTFKVVVHAVSPDETRRSAAAQNPGYVGQSVKSS